MEPMKPEIYGFAHSPFVIAIETALNSLGVEFTSKQVPNWDRSELLRLTNGASYEVPVLVHDGRVIFESSADSQDIARYVDQTFAAGKLFPEHLDGVQTLIIRYLENDVEGVTFRLFDPYYIASISDVAERGMIVRHKERKFGRGCIDEWKQNRDHLAAQAEELLKPLDSMLSHQPYLLGNEPVYADFLLAGILGNITFSGYNTIPSNLSRLTDFHRNISAL
jgi:glutathione S-transferase